jgi:hypothetical protein
MWTGFIWLQDRVGVLCALVNTVMNPSRQCYFHGCDILCQLIVESRSEHDPCHRVMLDSSNILSINYMIFVWQNSFAFEMTACIPPDRLDTCLRKQVDRMLRGITAVPLSFMRVCCFAIDFPIHSHLSAVSPGGLDYKAFKVAVFPVLSVEFQFNLSGLLSAYLECCC